MNTCFTYDAAGNVIKSGAITYTYDAENRLIATAGTSYVYDGDGNRVEKCTEGTTPGTCASSSTGMLYWLGAGPSFHKYSSCGCPTLPAFCAGGWAFPNVSRSPSRSRLRAVHCDPNADSLEFRLEGVSFAANISSSGFPAIATKRDEVQTTPALIAGRF
ncbi:MAG TPA: hypothetical protein VIW68_14695 [Candidatus Sulfotelmatobacter sp.]